MVFNGAMNDDAARIKRLGGPAQLAETLGFDKAGGTQRVHNWIERGIPSKVKLERPDLFLVPLEQLPEPAPEATPEPQQQAA